MEKYSLLMRADGHTLNVVEADATAIEPTVVQSVSLAVLIV